MDSEQGQPPRRTSASVVRKDDFDMRLGKVVMYTIVSTGFSVVAHRMGVACRGQTPLMTADGLENFKLLLDHARVHYRHFKEQWDTQTPQTYLTEAEVEKALAPTVALAEG